MGKCGGGGGGDDVHEDLLCFLLNFFINLILLEKK